MATIGLILSLMLLMHIVLEYAITEYGLKEVTPAKASVGLSAALRDKFFGGRLHVLFRQNKIDLEFLTRIFLTQPRKLPARASFPGLPAYDVLKNPSPTTRKICADRTRQEP